jgi:hypothetical protein
LSQNIARRCSEYPSAYLVNVNTHRGKDLKVFFIENLNCEFIIGRQKFGADCQPRPIPTALRRGFRVSQRILNNHLNYLVFCRNSEAFTTNYMLHGLSFRCSLEAEGGPVHLSTLSLLQSMDQPIRNFCERLLHRPRVHETLSG